MTAPGTGSCQPPATVATTVRELALQQGHCITAKRATRAMNACADSYQRALALTQQQNAALQFRQAQQRVLQAPTVAALAHEMDSLRCRSSRSAEPTVVLGQGIEDGANTQLLRGLVLGRLDGHQPPVWLRPDSHFERC